jgi:hypothetical protein
MCLTSRMTYLRTILIFLPLALLQTGCSNPGSQAQGNVDSSGQTVSSVPWNKPENWETGGQLGSMTQ